MQNARFRWGFDLGTNSIGWCVLRLDEKGEPCGVERLGSRIFSDGRNPKDKQPLAVARRLARQMRKQRDRRKRRLAKLRNTLRHYGLLPNEVAGQKTVQREDPWKLRARGLDEKLEAFELGRAIFHLGRRRGFQSNRKSDRKSDEKGEIAQGVIRLKAELAESGSRTVGEWCAKRVFEGKTARARSRAGEKAGNRYEFYPLRDLTRSEFNALWTKQAEFHPELLSMEAANAVADVLFHQRPLKPVQAGKCTFIPTEDRLPKASIYFQQFRLLQELNHLQIINRRRNRRFLTLTERDKLRDLLTKKKKVTFQNLKKTLKLESDDTFSIESDARQEFTGDEVQSVLADKKRFGDRWWSFSIDERERIVSMIEDADDDEALERAIQKEFGVEEEVAEAIANAPIPAGYGRVGLTATKAILAQLETDIIPYSDAAKAAGFHHSDFRPGERRPALPYYGEVLPRQVMPPRADLITGDADADKFGKIANPTVHIALNQLRKIVNELLKLYGAPAEVAIEVARDLKLSDQQKQELAQEQAKNKKANDFRADRLREAGIAVNARNLMKMQLWEALDEKDHASRQCVFTGEKISFTQLFSDDSPYEIEHLLPFSRTLDDSRANRVLSARRANRYKGNRSPFEAFSKSADGYDWDAILARANRLQKSTKWRFEEDAMKRFEEKEGFLARQLNDTRYLSRLAKEYVLHIALDPDQVWVSPGKMTAWLRRKWNINSVLAKGDFKNRDDHRHHALDAFVIGVTSRSLLKKVATLSGQFESEAEERLGEVPDPWPGFRDELRTKIERVVVSHRVDHGKQGGLHLETAYGFDVVPAELAPHDRVTARLVTRKSLDEMTFKKLGDLEKIRDKRLAADIAEFAKTRGGELSKEVLAAYREAKGVRKVRVIDENKTVIAMPDPSGRITKGYEPGSNYCYEIFETRDKKGNIKWDGEVISRYDANRKDFVPKWRKTHPAAKKVMRLVNGDCIGAVVDDRPTVLRVVRMTQGQLGLAEHYEGGELAKRTTDENDPFKLIRKGVEPLRKELRACAVHVDVLGRVRGLPKSPLAATIEDPKT